MKKFCLALTLIFALAAHADDSDPSDLIGNDIDDLVQSDSASSNNCIESIAVRRNFTDNTLRLKINARLNGRRTNQEYKLADLGDLGDSFQYDSAAQDIQNSDDYQNRFCNYFRLMNEEKEREASRPLRHSTRPQEQNPFLPGGEDYTTQ